MKIILINGAPGSGKSTFCDLAIKQSYEVTEYSTITAIKDIAEQIGWDGRKTLKDRKFLSDLKDLLTEYNDFPVRDCEEFIKAQVLVSSYRHSNIEPIIFIHCREPEELDRLKEKWHAKTLIIRRFSAEHVEVSNHADAEVLQYDYDYSIDNDGTLDELKQKALEFIECIAAEEFESTIERN